MQMESCNPQRSVVSRTERDTQRRDMEIFCFRVLFALVVLPCMYLLIMGVLVELSKVALFTSCYYLSGIACACVAHLLTHGVVHNGALEGSWCAEGTVSRLPI